MRFRGGFEGELGGVGRVCQGVRSPLDTQDKLVESQRILGISARFGGVKAPATCVNSVPKMSKLVQKG